MRVEAITQENEFARMSGEWDALLGSSAQDGPFLRHHWLHTWWRQFGGQGDLLVLTCCGRNGELLGVMPSFAVTQGRLTRVRTIRFLGDRQVGSTGLTAFARRDVETEVFESFASYLRNDVPGWDMIDLEYMDPAHGFHDLVAQQRGARVYADCGACPRVALPSDWECYLASLPSKKRSDLKRAIRRAEEQGAEIERVDDPGLLPEALDDLIHLNEIRLRTKLGPDYSWSPEYRAFTSKTIERLHADGRLRLTFLRIDGVRKAVNYMFRYRDTMYGELNGFDADGSTVNLLRPLTAAGFKMAIEEGCTAFDMLLGDQRNKFDWGAAEVRVLSRIHVYNTSLAGLVRGRRDGIVDWISR